MLTPDDSVGSAGPDAPNRGGDSELKGIRMKHFPVPAFARTAVLAASIAALSAAAAAEEATPPAEKPLPEVVVSLKKKIYNLSAAGLKTLETQIHIPLLADIPLFKTARIKLYFKTPDMQELDVEGVDAEMKPHLLAMIKDLTEFTKYLFGLGPVVDYICSCEIDVTDETHEKFGAVKKISARPKEEKKDNPEPKGGGKEPGKDPPPEDKGKETPEPRRLGLITIWVDKDLKPIRMTQDLDGGFSDLEIEVIEKDSKYLISQITLKRKTAEKAETRIKINITYDKIKELWLPKEIAIPSSQGQAGSMKVSLKDTRVNEDLPQHVFKKKDKEEPPQGKDKDKEY